VQLVLVPRDALEGLPDDLVRRRAFLLERAAHVGDARFDDGEWARLRRQHSREQERGDDGLGKSDHGDVERTKVHHDRRPVSAVQPTRRASSGLS